MTRTGDQQTAPLYLALLHYPVLNKEGGVIHSAVTNLDLHDISRACRTYGVRGFFVVTPLEDQQRLVGRILEHWVTGAGGKFNPDRKNALSLVKVTRDLDEAVDQVSRRENRAPVLVATDARKNPDTLACGDFAGLLSQGRPCLLLFGTAWGLAPECLARVDRVLEPLWGPTDYNHLSVRSAAAIYLDRVLGRP